MTGHLKTLISIGIVALLALVIGLTWYLTKRSLTQALTPPATPTLSEQATTKTTQETEKPADTSDKTSSSKILIPIVKGWNLKAVPYFMSPNTAATVFANASTTDIFDLNAEIQKHRSVFDEDVTVVPGKGFWLRSEKGEVLELVGTTLPVNETKAFVINLKTGWNLIGNPFAKDLSWNPTVDTGTQTMTLEKAISENVVTKTYAWSPSAESYLVLNSGQTLKKFQAVLIKTGGPVKLLVNPE